MLVKICGIQTVEAAKVAVDSGADFIGFVFAKSSRQIIPEQARKIVKEIPNSVLKVGVFVNEEPTIINNIARKVGLDIVQLHGDESPTITKEINYPIIKAYSIDQMELIKEQNFPSKYFIIDSPPTIYRGGTGKTFNWDLAKNLAIDPKKMILAGGLHPDNVKEAISIVNPVGVDVSSGVETNGVKDLEKIKQFITNAKG